MTFSLSPNARFTQFGPAAREIFAALGDYKDSAERFRECRYQKALSLFEDGACAEAVAIFQELPDDGNAQFDLGLCYANGYGVEQDLGQAVEWFEKAAGQDCADAQYILGSCYYNGDGVEQDYGKAFEMLMKAAEQGLANAQLAVARCYLRGEGVKQNDAKANEWIDKAVEQGMDIDDIIAMYQ